MLASMKGQHSQVRIAFVDIQLPDGNGIDLIKALKDLYQIPVIAISGELNHSTINECIKNGATGFVQKTSKLKIYSCAIQAVLLGGQFFPQDLIYCQNYPHSKSVENLSHRQKQILNLVFAGKSNKAIANQLSLADGTVRNHISVLLNIFEVESRTQLVSLLMKTGYRLSSTNGSLLKVA